MGKKSVKYIERRQLINSLVSKWEQLLHAIHKEPAGVQSCSIFSINSPEDRVTNALINPQKMQLWETLLMLWTTILKFRMILLNWRDEPKINRAGTHSTTRYFKSQDSGSPQTESKTIWVGKNPVAKAIQLLSSSPSLTAMRTLRQMSGCHLHMTSLHYLRLLNSFPRALQKGRKMTDFS